MTKLACQAALLLYLVFSGCSPDKPNQALVPTAFIRHDLGMLTVQVPATWQAIDERKEGLAPMKTGQQHVFVNAASSDTIHSETLVVLVKPERRPFAVAKVKQGFVQIFSELLGPIHLVHVEDTVLQQGRLVLLEFTVRTKPHHLDMIGTMAFYQRGTHLVTVQGMARQYSARRNQQNRALLRKVIYSIQWK
ncbi:hypothetical protein PK28_17385 (plasmid) [Hymenobacter sp. DG25B]|uniref:hypothetical protein n=1 Tax=Hymenobacter sp. DG25B TaxID=1385664 RepID=UPI00054111A7|nr:hypothetical protein [Hymenobacter sp. DG25B]AIZ65437.1 hypothetical protein PK28_17385 [Hymenobacter sp. DG25B]